MANIRDLKKDINYVLGDIIEAVYLWELTNPKIKWCKDAGPWGGDFGCCVMQNKQPCPTGRAAGNLDGYPKCKSGSIGSSDNSGASNKLAILNDQLMNLSKQMWEATQKIHSSDIKLQQELDN